MISTILRFIKKFIPKPLFNFVAPTYHWLLARTGSLLYGLPSRKLIVVGVTGTKGKSSTLEFLNAILEEAGYTTAIASTIRHKIGKESRPNLFKMTMQGRFFIHSFLAEAVKKGVSHALIEMTSEGALQYRHAFIDMDAFIVTNIAPEHIESHGSFENYLEAKLSIARSLQNSYKKQKLLVTNADDPGLEPFRKITGVEHLSFSKNNPHYKLKLPGDFNQANAQAAATLARAWNIDEAVIARALSRLTTIPGRVEDVASRVPDTQFNVVVDYAHTPDSLSALYGAYEGKKKICVLSGTGGGRDGWKRPVMGEIADKACDDIVLTDEDPYDEDPKKIVDEIRKGITRHTPIIELDRRKAIRLAIAKATPGSVVLITGKGTDPYIMGPRGTKTPWSDSRIAEEELRAILKK